MLKNTILKNVAGSTLVKIEAKKSSNTKGESIVIRVKGNNLVKRYVNRLYVRSADKMDSFAKEIGCKKDILGEHEISFSTLIQALEVFPNLEKKDV